MKTVIEACKPHQGLIDGTLNLEVFTAALGPVIDYYHQKGKANIDKIYTDAEIFFREATYPTDGLKQLVGNVFRRIAGDMTADSVMKLETAFGGGKPHSLISCVHIAYRGTEIEEWDMVQGMIMAYREGDIPVARAYLQKHGAGSESKLFSILQIWADNCGNEDLRKETQRLLFGLKA